MKRFSPSFPKIEWRLAALKNGFHDATVYRIEFLLQILGSAFVPAAIQWVLWYALFKTGGAQEIAGMTYTELLQYTWTSILFTQVRGGDHDFELQEMIRTGQLSNYLLRPVSAIEFVYIRGVSPRLFIAIVCLTLGILLNFFLGFSLPLRLVGAMFMALMGNVIHYQLGAALSSTAFFWEEAYSVLMVKNMVVSLLSGELIPLHFFSSSLSWIWKSAPFYLYVYGPTQYVLGKWSHSQFIYESGLACLWMLLGGLLIQLTWKWGMRRYLSLGG